MLPERISSVGLDLIKKFEGCHDIRSDGMVHSYRDPVDVWTIGYGHTKGVKSGQSISMEKAEEFLLEDVKDAVWAVRKFVKVPLTQYQFDALVSFTFNLGSGNLRGSTLLRILNAGQYDKVPEQLNRWNKGKVNGKLVELRGLTRRRSAEAALFMMDTPLAGDGGDLMVQKPRAGTPTTKPLVKSRTMWGAGTAGAGTVAGIINDTAGELQGLVSYSDTLKYVFLALTVAGIALAAYARWDDHNKAVK